MTQSVAEFKNNYGIKALSPKQTTSGKAYFTTDNGIEGKVSTRSIPALRDHDLSEIRISWCVELDELNVPTGKEFWQLHNVQSSDNGDLIIQLW